MGRGHQPGAQTWYLMLKDLETLRNLAKQYGSEYEEE